MEIGSIYEINPETVKLAEREAESRIPQIMLPEVLKYDKNHVLYTKSGREAIAAAIKSLEKKNPELNKKCLMPAYMCDSVFFPFERAGWQIDFYHIGQNLKADQEDLLSKLKRIRPGLLFVHCYFGMDTWKPMRSLFKTWQKSGTLIMEDVTQSYYLKDAGMEADYTIGSLRKWYPVPDGGFVSSDAPLFGENLTESREFKERRLALLSDKWNYLYGSLKEDDRKAIKESYLKRNRVMEEWLDQDQGMNCISGVTRGIFRLLSEETAKRKRNENYLILEKGLRGIEGFNPVFDWTDKSAAPLYYPVYAQNRDELQKFLQHHDIFAPVLWPVGSQNQPILTAPEKYIYSHLLAIPMDQRYGRNDMRRLIEVMEAYGATRKNG